MSNAVCGCCVTGVAPASVSAHAERQLWREATRTVSSVKTIEVGALTDQGNYAVIRLPERKFPGVVLQGDSLSILVANLRRSRDQLQQGEHDDGIGWLSQVLDDLEAVQRKYEAALTEHSIPLSY